MADLWDVHKNQQFDVGVLSIGGVAVTATPAELNSIADGATLVGADVTAVAKEINTLDLSAKFTLYEDFFGTWAIGDAGPADTWVTTAGSGTGNQVATTVAASLNGEVTLKSASNDGTHAANNSVINGIGLAWKANSGGLAMEARVKIDDVSEAYFFCGFTDVAATTVEAPIFMNAADLDSDATDACGVVYDIDATTDVFYVGGVKNNTDTAPTSTGITPVDATYFIVRVEVSAAGAVTGYINGTAFGPVADAVTVTTALTPAIVIGNRSANQVIATIDYIKVEQNRV